MLTIIAEYVILFVILSILINMFIYRKFLYCEFLILQDLLLLIPTTIIAFLSSVIIFCTTFAISYVVWFKQSNFISFIKPFFESKKKTNEE